MEEVLLLLYLLSISSFDYLLDRSRIICFSYSQFIRVEKAGRKGVGGKWCFDDEPFTFGIV
jgi:hypothetical protein